MAVRCRQIGPGDLDAVVAVLCRGFKDRDPAYWRRGFARHRDRDPPSGHPAYGFLLEDGGRVVGVLLTLHTSTRDPSGPSVRCNLSSWYVEPAYRSFGILLDRMATREPSVTYFNVTPSPPTWPMLEARRYHRYCLGQMLALPVLSRPRPGQSVRRVEAGDALDTLAAGDRGLVQDHLGYGCLAFVCDDEAGPRPVLLQRRTIGVVPNLRSRGRIPAHQLIYARSLDDVVLFAGSLGRCLARISPSPLLVFDAAFRVPGLAGMFFPGRAPKYQRGPAPVRLGDLAYSELVLFGP